MGVICYHSICKKNPANGAENLAGKALRLLQNRDIDCMMVCGITEKVCFAPYGRGFLRKLRMISAVCFAVR